MRDEKEERKKQARSNKQTRQSNTAHPHVHVVAQVVEHSVWSVECRGFESHPRQLIFLLIIDCLGCAVLLCFVVYMTLLASIWSIVCTLHNYIHVHLEQCVYMHIDLYMYIYMLMRDIEGMNTVSCNCPSPLSHLMQHPVTAPMGRLSVSWQPLSASTHPNSGACAASTMSWMASTTKTLTAVSTTNRPRWWVIPPVATASKRRRRTATVALYRCGGMGGSVGQWLRGVILPLEVGCFFVYMAFALCEGSENSLYSSMVLYPVHKCCCYATHDTS